MAIVYAYGKQRKILDNFYNPYSDLINVLGTVLIVHVPIGAILACFGFLQVSPLVYGYHYCGSTSG